MVMASGASGENNVNDDNNVDETNVKKKKRHTRCLGFLKEKPALIISDVFFLLKKQVFFDVFFSKTCGKQSDVFAFRICVIFFLMIGRKPPMGRRERRGRRECRERF